MKFNYQHATTLINVFNRDNWLFLFYGGKYITIEGEAITNSLGGFFFPENYVQKIFCNEIITENMLMYWQVIL